MFDHKFVDAYSHTLLQMTDMQEAHWFAKHTLKNKLLSKQWLVQELTKIFIPQNTCILGSWYGTLLPYLLSRQNAKFTCVDIDPSLATHTSIFNDRLYEVNRVKFVCADARSYIQASTEAFDCIVNTSCEHMPYDMKDVIWNPAPVYVLQSNNYDIPEHTNFKHSLEDFVESTGLSSVLYADTKRLNRYDRYMVIGKL